eukprot:5908299-Pyramimonas_sp.AAC.1
MPLRSGAPAPEAAGSCLASAHAARAPSSTLWLQPMWNGRQQMQHTTAALSSSMSQTLLHAAQAS